MLRSAVVKVLGCEKEMLTACSDGWAGYWKAFSEYLADTKSVFRLTCVRDRPEAKLRSGDRRSSIDLKIDEKGGSVLQMNCHTKARAISKRLESEPDVRLVDDVPDALAIVVIGKQVDPRNSVDRRSHFEWIENAAYRLRATHERAKS